MSVKTHVDEIPKRASADSYMQFFLFDKITLWITMRVNIIAIVSERDIHRYIINTVHVQTHNGELKIKLTRGKRRERKKINERTTSKMQRIKSLVVAPISVMLPLFCFYFRFVHFSPLFFPLRFALHLFSFTSSVRCFHFLSQRYSVWGENGARESL